MMEWLGYVIAAVVVWMLARMLFKTSRQTVDDVKEIKGNPTGFNLIGGGWNLLFIAVLVYAYMNGVGLGGTVAIVAVWFVGLFLIMGAFARKGKFAGRNGRIEFFYQVAGWIMTAMALGILYISRQYGVAVPWGVIGAILFWFICGGLLQMTYERLKEGEE